MNLWLLIVCGICGKERARYGQPERCTHRKAYTLHMTASPCNRSPDITGVYEYMIRTVKPLHGAHHSGLRRLHYHSVTGRQNGSVMAVLNLKMTRTFTRKTQCLFSEKHFVLDGRFNLQDFT